MQFTVSNATEATRKIRAFTELFDSDPTSITIAGLFEDRSGEWISAWENDPYSHIHVIGFKRTWIRVMLEHPMDIRPIQNSFELYLH